MRRVPGQTSRQYGVAVTCMFGVDLVRQALPIPAEDTISARIVGREPAELMLPQPDLVTRESGPALK